ncbi:MAG: tRNA dihydrouridine synthase [Pseudobdellovibrionaceae bacterium]
MEGVVDWVLRDTLTRMGGLDQCVTEFMRVTNMLLPAHLFYDLAPELNTNSKTAAGTPVFYQLLGGQPEPLAQNAVRAVELGACGIDLNFGCPAKTVNRHDGGATLLQYPDRLFDIVSAVRKALPAHIPVTAKMRLGFMEANLYFENAKALEEAGATWITVHARTKADGYKPPAYWEKLAEIRESVKVPVIGNGEVWTLTDYIRIREISGCQDIMIGRACLANPFLFQEIKAYLDGKESLKSSPAKALALVPPFFAASEKYRHSKYAVQRSKQWIKQLSLFHPELEQIFNSLKILIEPEEFRRALTLAAENFSPTEINYSSLVEVNSL